MNEERDPGVEAWRTVAELGQRGLRSVLGTFLTGVTVITTRDADGVPRGFTANSFTSVSLEPPMILFCIAKAAASHGAFTACERFAVSMLKAGQRDLSQVFSSNADRQAKFAQAAHHEGWPPVIDDALGAVVCRRGAVHDAGDHSIVLGEILSAYATAGEPLGYFRGGYVDIGAAAHDIDTLRPEAVRIALLIDDRGRVLLRHDTPGDAWELPSAPLVAGNLHRQTIPALLGRLGVVADLSTLYSVFQDEGDAFSTIVYRGETSQPVAPGGVIDGVGYRFFAIDDEPWNLIRRKSHAEVLRRYFTERKSSVFGIYWDTPDASGRIASIHEHPKQWRRQGESIGS